MCKSRCVESGKTGTSTVQMCGAHNPYHHPAPEKYPSSPAAKTGGTFGTLPCPSCLERHGTIPQRPRGMRLVALPGLAMCPCRVRTPTPPRNSSTGSCSYLVTASTRSRTERVTRGPKHTGDRRSVRYPLSGLPEAHISSTGHCDAWRGQLAPTHRGLPCDSLPDPRGLMCPSLICPGSLHT